MNEIIKFIGEADFCMKLLMAISMISFAIIIEKYAAFRRFATQITAFGAIKEVRDITRLPEGPLKTAFADIGGYDDRETLKQFMDIKMGKLETLLMERVALLGLIATMAPMVGLIGTFTGVFHVFEGVSSIGLSDPKMVAKGIKEVLLDTVAGLVVAIPAMLAYKWFEGEASKIALAAEEKLFLLAGAAVRKAQGGGHADAA